MQLLHSLSRDKHSHRELLSTRGGRLLRNRKENKRTNTNTLCSIVRIKRILLQRLQSSRQPGMNINNVLFSQPEVAGYSETERIAPVNTNTTNLVTDYNIPNLPAIDAFFPATGINNTAYSSLGPRWPAIKTTSIKELRVIPSKTK